MANCERLDKKYLKTVLELPENNFEKNFCKTKIVDRFINDLQDKLRKFKLKKTADSKDALKIIMKVKIPISSRPPQNDLVPGHSWTRNEVVLRRPDFDAVKIVNNRDIFTISLARKDLLTSRRLSRFKNIFKILKKV